MDPTTIFLGIGFILAAYAVIANDSIQTLGTFLSSNEKLKWYWLLLYTGAILWFVLILGWYLNGGDLSFGRLEKIPLPENITFLHALAPAVLLFLTRYGIPVSTTFLVLSVFASSKTIESMVIKSALGYAVAAVGALVVWFALSRFLDEFVPIKESRKKFWIVGQWLATGFLWSQWLMHDMANIAVYLPREVPFHLLFAVLMLLTAFLGFIFYFKGGKIQQIVLTKTSTKYIRSATIIDLVYAVILFIFKEMSSIPMSTTWVFIGLLAGREVAINRLHKNIEGRKIIFPMLGKDFFKILVGLAVSILLALLVGWYSGN